MREELDFGSVATILFACGRAHLFWPVRNPLPDVVLFENADRRGSTKD